MPGLRRCRWCRHPLTDNPTAPTANARLRAAHCTNRQCDWCEPCRAWRERCIAAGRQDLLEPGPRPVPGESVGEQTREIPAVQDEIPPDQMT